MRVFERNKHITVDFEEGNLITAVEMEDNYHHFRVQVAFAFPSLEIKRASAEVVRAPNRQCYAVPGLVAGLVGIRVQPGFNRTVAKVVGGPGGCFHLGNLVGEAALAALQGIYAAANQVSGGALVKLPRDQRTRFWLDRRPEMLDSCLAWSAEGELVREAYPEGLPESLQARRKPVREAGGKPAEG